MPPTLAEARVSFIRSLKASDRAPGTLALYERCLRELEDWLGAHDKPLAVDDIESRHITDFLLYLAQRPKRAGHRYRRKPEGVLATETKRHYHRAMSSFFNWCQREGLLNGHMPMRNIKKPMPEHKEIRTLSDQEVQRFLDLLDSPEAKKQTLYVAFSLMYRLGLRISEVCNLRLSDLNLETGRLFVQGKGKKERELPIRNGVDKMLEAYLREVRPRFADGSDRLLVSYTGHPLSPSSLRRSFTRYARRAGIVGTPHVLRHSFATKAVRSGVSPFVLQRMLGHANLDTTMRYVHAGSFDDLAAALDKMG